MAQLASGVQLAKKIRSVLESDDVRTLRSMLHNSQVAVGDQDELSATLLHRACECNCPQCVNLLLQHTPRATLKLHDVSGYTPLHIAAHRNQTDVINLLLSHDQSLLDCLSTRHETPLMIACLAGHIGVVKHLLHLGAKSHIKSADGSTLVHYAANSGVAEVLEHVLQLKGMRESVNIQNNHGKTPSHNAMGLGCFECVEVLCRHGADLSISNNSHKSPMDIAFSLNNQKCLKVVNNFTGEPHSTTKKGARARKRKGVAHKAVCSVPQEPSESQREYPIPSTPPPSLRNDQKEIHGTTRVETDTLLHGECNGTSSEDSSQEENDGNTTDGLFSRATTHSLCERRSDRKQPNDDCIPGRSRVQSLPYTRGTVPSQYGDFPPTKPMKKKTPKPTVPDSAFGTEAANGRVDALKPVRGRTSDHPKTDPVRKRSDDASEKRLPPKSDSTSISMSSELTRPKEPQIRESDVKCPQCGNFMLERITICEGASNINFQDAQIIEATKVHYPGVFCPACDRNRPFLSSRPDSGLHLTTLPMHQPITNSQETQQHSQEQIDSGIYLSFTESPDMQEGESHQGNGIPQVEHKAHGIVMDTQPKDVKGRYGDEVVLQCRAQTTNSSDLNYQWFWKKGGKSTKIKGAKEPELRLKLDFKKSSVAYCRVSLANNKDSFLYSKDARITPMLVWFDEQPQPINDYLGEKATLTCRADTAPGVKGPIRYVWLKRVSKESKLEFYTETLDGKLTFDPLTHENEGYYICQADITSQHEDSDEVYVKGKICSKRRAGPLQITKEPRSYAAIEGSQLSLSCEAKQTGGGGSLHYQWYRNGTAIAGETSSTYKKRRAQSSDIGIYYCTITSDCGQSVTTKYVEVALAHPDTARVDYVGKSSIQRDQIEARRHLKTIEEKRFAHEKVALLIGNQCYEDDSLPDLSTPENDVKSLTTTLTECGFKVFSMVNLKYHEMMSALQDFYNLLAPGIYAIFAYMGHGCTYQGVTYLIPVDAYGPVPSQCVSNATISDNMQQHLCRVFKFIDCCRLKSTEETSYCPNNSRKYNFANLFEICSCADGQKSYEDRSQSCSSFNRALTTAIKMGGTLTNVSHNIGKLMARNCESICGATYAEPVTLVSPLMDKEISLHDEVMLEDPKCEEKLDLLLETWNRVHTPPMPMKVKIGEVLSKFLNVAELEFSWEFSNVLLIKMKWQIYTTACTGCSVTMSSEDQDVVTTELPPAGAMFRIMSLKRSQGELKLLFTFSITSTDGTLSQYTVPQDLKCRPL